MWLLARRLSVNPMQRIRVMVNILSVSIKPHVHIVVGVVTVWDKPLKHVVDVLICDDRQCGVQASTKLSRFIPIQHWTVRVETILLIVHLVALGKDRYDIYDVQQNQQTSCKDPLSLLQVPLHRDIPDLYQKGNELFWRAVLRRVRLCYAKSSDRLSLCDCDVQLRWSHTLEYFENNYENNFTAD